MRTNTIARRVLSFFTVVAGLSAQVVLPNPNQISIVYGNNQSTTPSTQFQQPLTVRLTSPSGVPIANAPVTFTLPAPPQAGVPGANFTTNNNVTQPLAVTVFTNALGFASSPLLTSYAPPGTFAASATSPGVSSAQFQLKTILLPSAVPPVVLPNLLTFSMVLGGSTPQAQGVSVNSDPVNYYTLAADAPWIRTIPRTYNTLDVAVDPTGLATRRQLPLCAARWSRYSVRGSAQSTMPIQAAISRRR